MGYVTEQVGPRGPKVPEIKQFLDEFEVRREAEKGMRFCCEGDPDPTAEILSTGTALGGNETDVLRLDDHYLARYVQCGAASVQKVVLALVDATFVEELHAASAGTRLTDADRTRAWLQVFERHGIR